MGSLPQRPWQEIAAEQQALRDSALPTEWLIPKDQLPGDSVKNVMDVPYKRGLLTKEELDITDKDVTELLELMAAGKLTSYAVTKAFCKRATIAQQLLNCLTQTYFDEALERAKELDEILATTGKPVGPYHGLPFSIKDQYKIKGKDASSGFIAWVGNISTEDAHIVQILRDAGAVIYCKTNNPQTLMHLETVSNVYGRTLNPYNRDLTPGGSSGGEGALVAFHGSPIGLGADGGGSIRSPAANNGLYGLKPTSSRVPRTGCTVTGNGCEAYPVVVGPICRSARDNEYFMKVVLGTEPWRVAPDLVPLPWREQETPKTLTIGVYSDDGVCRPHPPITKAVEKLSELLKATEGITVVPFEPFMHFEGYDTVRRLYYEDGGKEVWDVFAASGEPALENSKWILKESHAKRCTIEESWALNVKREDFRKAYLDHWNATVPQVDLVLCPVGPSVAPKHDTSRYWGYTAIYNCLDYPATAFPTGWFVTPEEHPQDEGYVPRENEFDRYNWENYDPVAYQGAPISLQLVGRKWDCEKVVAGLLRVDEVLRASR